MKFLTLCFLSTCPINPQFISIAEGQSRAHPPTARRVAHSALSSLVLLAAQGSKEQLRLGTGFFVAADLVATNYHVIQGGTDVRVRIVGEGMFHEVLGLVVFDRKSDLCILRVRREKGQRLTLAAHGHVAIGDEVYVAGNPEGLEGTLSKGIVSSFRQFDGLRYVQISAPISSGSSGGPVLNQRGQVIAVATAMLGRGQNLNFAVPVSYLVPLVAKAVRVPKNSFVASIDDLPVDENEAQAMLYLSQGQTHYRQNRYGEALSALEKATDLKPDYGDAHYYTALVLRDLGRYDDAVNAAKRAVQSSPSDCTDHYLLGRLYALVGDKQSARKVCTRLDSLGCRDLSDELFRVVR